MPDSWLYIACIRGCKRHSEQVLYGDAQTASVSLSFPVHTMTCPRVGGETAAASLVAPLQGTVLSSCVSLVTIKRCVRHQPSLKSLKTMTVTGAVCSKCFRQYTKDADQHTVETQFRHSWRHKTTCPEVRAVYKIIITTASLKKYEQYL